MTHATHYVDPAELRRQSTQKILDWSVGHEVRREEINDLLLELNLDPVPNKLLTHHTLEVTVEWSLDGTNIIDFPKDGENAITFEDNSIYCKHLPGVEGRLEVHSVDFHFTEAE